MGLLTEVSKDRESKIDRDFGLSDNKTIRRRSDSWVSSNLERIKSNLMENLQYFYNFIFD